MIETACYVTTHCHLNRENLILKFLWLQLVELKEAEQLSLKESERLEKEVADVQDLKVTPFTLSLSHTQKKLNVCAFL